MKRIEKTKSNQVSIAMLKDAGEEVRKAVREQMRNSVLEMIQGLVSQEVEELCGKPFSRKTEAQFHRGGWDPGSVKLAGQRVQVKKPRVRDEGGEVELQSHSALQEFDMLCDRVTKQMLHVCPRATTIPCLTKL